MKIAVPSDDGERISSRLVGSLLFLVYRLEGGRVVSVEKRARHYGIMAAVRDCDIVLARDCPDPIRELLAVRGIGCCRSRRNRAEAAVRDYLARPRRAGRPQATAG